MLNEQLVLERYQHIHPYYQKLDKVRFPGSSFVGFCGETIFDSEHQIGIQIVGDQRLGKTTTVRSLTTSDKRYVHASSDWTPFDYRQGVIVPYWGNLNPFPIKLLIHFMKEGRDGFTNRYLKQTFDFIQREIGLVPVDFQRTEGDIDDTVLRLHSEIVARVRNSVPAPFR
jgi:hypothetical protein